MLAVAMLSNGLRSKRADLSDLSRYFFYYITDWGSVQSQIHKMTDFVQPKENNEPL